MRSFNKLFPLILIILAFHVLPSFAAETEVTAEPIALYETTEFKVFNRTLSGDKETCEATNGSLFPLGALGTSQTMMEYTSPITVTGCRTGTILLVENARVTVLIEREKNFEAHLLTMKYAELKEVNHTIDRDTRVQMLGADEDKGVDWGVAHLCMIRSGGYLNYRNIIKGNGIPVIVFLYTKGAGSDAQDSCLDNSYIIASQIQFTQILGSIPFNEKKIPVLPAVKSTRPQAVARPNADEVLPESADEVGPDEEPAIEKPVAKPKSSSAKRQVRKKR